MDLDAFWNGGAEAVDFHDIPVVDRPCYVEMKQFIDNEGQLFCPLVFARSIGWDTCGGRVSGRQTALVSVA